MCEGGATPSLSLRQEVQEGVGALSETSLVVSILGSNPMSATSELCDFGQVSRQLCAWFPHLQSGHRRSTSSLRGELWGLHPLIWQFHLMAHIN